MARSINYQDHGDSISRVAAILSDPEYGFARHRFDPALSTPFMPQPDGNRRSSIVLADETSIELGSSANRSVSMLLWTSDVDKVPEGIWVAGNDFNRAKSASVSYAQCVICALGEKADPMDPRLVGLKNLTNRIPGFMTRSLPGKLWIRIGHDLIRRGFSASLLGQCLYDAHREYSPDILKISVIVAVENPLILELLEAIAADARTISATNTRRRLEQNNDFSCDELNCDACGERAACDTLRDVVIRRRLDVR